MAPSVKRMGPSSLCFGRDDHGLAIENNGTLLIGASGLQAHTIFLGNHFNDFHLGGNGVTKADRRQKIQGLSHINRAGTGKLHPQDV